MHARRHTHTGCKMTSALGNMSRGRYTCVEMKKEERTQIAWDVDSEWYLYVCVSECACVYLHSCLSAYVCCGLVYPVSILCMCCVQVDCVHIPVHVLCLMNVHLKYVLCECLNGVLVGMY